ncbi:glucosaminidase domain-containing protein [Aquimarina rhabdastrellae]
MNLRAIFLILSVSTILFSCGGSKKVVKTAPKKPTRTRVITRSVKKVTPEKKEETKPKVVRPYKERVQYYIYEYASIAKNEMQEYGIPASITLAQGILESGAGAGDLTQRANNHFGIKCHDWTGERVYHDDDRAQECFRKYDEAKTSFRDHSLFLANRKRYAGLFTLKKDDYKGWAKGLRKAGYATDVKYPTKLISIIERYQLYKYDDEVLGKSTPTKVITEETVTTKIKQKPGQHIVEEGDTLYSISRRYKLKVTDLKKYNSLTDNNIRVGQVLKTKAGTSQQKTEETEEDTNEF